MYSISDLIEKYDVDNGFKIAVSNLISKMDTNDIIEVLTDNLTDLLYSVSYDYDREIDDGGNVRIGIQQDIKEYLELVFLKDSN